MALVGDRVAGKQQIIGSQFFGEPRKGDRLSEVDDDGNLKEEWSFDGSFWLSSFKETEFNFSNLDATALIILSIDKSYDLLLKNLNLNYFIEGKNEASKYWIFNFYRVNNSLGRTLLNSIDSLSQAYNSLSLNINLEDKIALNDTFYYQLEAQKIGSPGILSIAGNLIYQHKRPK